MADSPPIPSIWELDYCDLTLYQHPPCMFTLWYLGLAVNAAWDPVKDLLDRIMKCIGGEEGGGGGGSEGEKKEEKGDEGEKGEEGNEEEGGEGGKQEESGQEAEAEEEPEEGGEEAEG